MGNIWEMVTEHPAATGDGAQQVTQAAQPNAAIREPSAVARSCHMKADISLSPPHVRASPTTKRIKKGCLKKQKDLRFPLKVVFKNHDPH